MKPEPLKGRKEKMYTDYEKGISYHAFLSRDVKRAVQGLIKFHEDRIEELIKEWKTLPFKYLKRQYGGDLDWTCSSEGWDRHNELIKEIDREYESIMAIEYWLEDVI